MSIQKDIANKVKSLMDDYNANIKLDEEINKSIIDIYEGENDNG